MKNNTFRKFLRLVKNLSADPMQKSTMSRHRKRKIIPDEYFVDVITTIPERNAVIVNIDF